MTSNDNDPTATPEIEVPDFLKPREIGPLLPERTERRRGRWWFLAVPVAIAVLMVAVVLQFGSDERPVRAVAVPGYTPSPVPSVTPSASPSPPPSTSSSTSAPPSKRPTSSPPKRSTPPRAHKGAIVGIGGRCLAVDRGGVQLAVCADRSSQRWAAPGDGTVRLLDRWCLDVQSSGEANGTPVILYPCNRSDAQQWQRRGDGTWRNPQSNKCLGTVGGRSEPGTRLAVFDCGSGAHQRWSLT
ncbi:hypothetical protein GCM10009557_48890 [Virgisporangium ochraceum]|uniref:Ricin B lectin domain-containing protein n=1 Tax=Virgisporangium ochraceum TaxID=65505 RepID=A0A8J4EC27_9ACTN|nr:RICIN domain-containing protein [Virgisporangium ochraceum]GIJ70030.1 hypothetical protein Voc01_049470 [Virgisporangium ochraceum]